MRVEIEIRNNVLVPPNNPYVVLTLTLDEAMHLKRIINRFQSDDKNRHALTQWTRRVKTDLWRQLDGVGITMAQEAEY